MKMALDLFWHFIRVLFWIGIARIVVVAAAVIGIAALTWYLLTPLTPPKVTGFDLRESGAKDAIQGEVSSILKKKNATGSNIGELSPRLRKAIDNEPDFVIVCMIAIESRFVPGLSREDEDRILITATCNSAAAVRDLQRCLYRNMTKLMEESGYDPKTEPYWPRYNNNRSTARLFIDLPLAEKLGKKREFITRELEGFREGAKEWYEPEVSSDQYREWHGSGKWPFSEERSQR